VLGLEPHVMSWFMTLGTDPAQHAVHDVMLKYMALLSHVKMFWHEEYKALRTGFTLSLIVHSSLTL
jgi:hypothetical protein